MHRGLIIAFIQAVFSSLFFFVAVPIYTGWLLVGYTTIFTMLPAFSLVLDEDVDARTAYLYPELYKELQKGKPLSYKTFFMWLFLSVYQGGLIMIMSLVLFEDNFINIVSITFTALILCELANVALSIHSWKLLIALAVVISLIAYGLSMALLKSVFDMAFIMTWDFWWKVMSITLMCTLPPFLLKWLANVYSPAAHIKVNAMARARTR